MVQQTQEAPEAYSPTPEWSPVSWILVASIAIVVGMFWPLFAVFPYESVYYLRPPVLAAAGLLAIIWFRLRITAIEIRMGAYMAVMCVILIAPSLTSANPQRALQDVVKLAALCLIALAVSRALRDPATAKVFGYALLIASILCVALMLISYVKYQGFVIPTYKTAREFKGIAVKQAIPLNAIAFTSVFAYVMAMCLLRMTWKLRALGAFLLGVSTVFTGSRAPIGVLLMGLGALLLFNALRHPNLGARFAGYAVAIALVPAAYYVVFHVPFKTVSEITEGRWDLWSVAIAKFKESPIVGYGFESWRDDLVSRLPGQYEMTSGLALEVAGGYHNEYLTMLAEQGILGTVPTIALFGFLLILSWRLAFRRWRTWDKGQWGLFGCLYLMVRGGVEMPGLFGYGQEPSDFLAWLFVAIVISRFSVEEDWLHYLSSRAAQRIQVQGGHVARPVASSPGKRNLAPAPSRPMRISSPE